MDIVPLPIALVLAGAMFWPATLAIAASVVVLGFARRRWLRTSCFVVAGVLAADCLIAVWLLGG